MHTKSLLLASALGGGIGWMLSGYGPKPMLDKPDDNGVTLDAKKVTEAIESVDKKLKEISDQVKNQAEDFAKKFATGQEASTALKESVDKALTEQGALREALDGLKARQTEIEQKMARGGRGNSDPDERKSPGQHFIDHENVKAFMDGGFKSRGRVRVDMKTIVTTDMPGLVEPVRVGDVIIPERRMTVRDLLTPGQTNSNSIQYWQETGFTNNADAVSEGTTKPESTITGELKTTNVATIAHIMIASKQILEDAPMLRSHIDGRLRYGLAYEEELELLLGDGSGTQLLGLVPQATAYAEAFQPEAMQRIDTIRLAILQSELALFPATGIVVNPTDWARIELTKDAEGRYIFAQPQTLAQPRLWSRPLVSTPAMTVTKFLVGAFRLGAQIFDREDANVEISTEDSDNFRKNLVTLRAEERLALAVYRPEAFIYGTFQATT